MADDKQDEQVRPYYLFTLTKLIGKVATAGRTTVILTQEVQLVSAIWFFASLAVTVVLALILGVMALGAYAVLIPLFVPMLITYFATTRSRSGLHLTHMRRTMDVLDRPWAKGHLVYAGRLYDPTTVRLVTVTPASVDVAALPGYEHPGPLEVFDAVGDSPRPEATLLARTADHKPIRSARGTAARVADVRTAMMDVVCEEERIQWARNWEAQQRRKREQLMIDIGAVQAPDTTEEENSREEVPAA